MSVEDRRPQAERGELVTELALPSVEVSVSAARRAVTALCVPAGVEDLCETAALLTSEVVTNAVVHGGGTVQVRARTADGRLRVEVQDDGGGAPEPQTARLDDEGGRGLALLSALSEAWGVEEVPGGKFVWFELAS